MSNDFAKLKTNITYKGIADMLYNFILKNCKNIGKSYHNTIPTHFNNTKNIQYSYINSYIDKKSIGYNSQTNYITIKYDTKANNFFNLISDPNIIKTNIKQIFNTNNIFWSDNETSETGTLIELKDIIKCCFIILEFLQQNVLRVYFPLTDSYSYFYKASNSDCNVEIPNFNLLNETDIINTFKIFLEYFTGCKIEQNEKTITYKNIIYSFLYTISSGRLNFDILQGSGSDDDTKFKFENKYNNFHINLT